jgi:hypothetical protein
LQVFCGGIYPIPGTAILPCEQEKTSHPEDAQDRLRHALQSPIFCLLKHPAFGTMFAIFRVARNYLRQLARLEYVVMQGKVKEEWMQLCEQAAIEQNSERLMALITEINRMLDEKEQRLKRRNLATPDADPNFYQR